MQQSDVLIISLHPEHANKLLSGKKKLEFRRVWARNPVKAVVIYSTSPVKKIVAIAYVKEIHYASRNQLWKLAKSIGGGLTREALYAYFKDKKLGYAVEFDHVEKFKYAVSTNVISEQFRAPQSFAYLSQSKFAELENLYSQQEAKGKVVFVGGVHGVGKTTMCEAFVNQYGFIHKSASQLIREEKVEAIANNSKAVQNIDSNQQLLIKAVSRLRKAGGNLLLDGHFAILNSGLEPTALPTEIFGDLAINTIVAIYDEPALIATRIAGRYEKAMNQDEICKFQNLEFKRAKQVSVELDLPFLQLKALDQNGFDKIVNESFRNET